MMFFFKKPTIHLDAFTTRKDVIEYAPVVNGIEKIPTWWKNLPKSYVAPSSFFPQATMKGCVGLSNYYNKSVAMPMWSDLSVNVSQNEGYQWQFSDGTSTADVHSNKQFEGFNLNGFSHLKLNSPWFFETKKDIEWMVSCPIYNLENHTDFVFPQGLLNFKRQYVTNIQLLLNTTQSRTFVIPFGTVFLFTPLSDSKVVIHRHLITEEQHKLKTQKSMLNTFINKYQIHNRAQKCPYKDETK